MAETATLLLCTFQYCIRICEFLAEKTVDLPVTCRVAAVCMTSCKQALISDEILKALTTVLKRLQLYPRRTAVQIGMLPYYMCTHLLLVLSLYSNCPQSVLNAYINCLRSHIIGMLAVHFTCTSSE